MKKIYKLLRHQLAGVIVGFVLGLGGTWWLQDMEQNRKSQSMVRMTALAIKSDMVMTQNTEQEIKDWMLEDKSLHFDKDFFSDNHDPELFQTLKLSIADLSPKFVQNFLIYEGSQRSAARHRDRFQAELEFESKTNPTNRTASDEALKRYSITLKYLNENGAAFLKMIANDYPKALR